METLTAAQIGIRMGKQFPRNATCWSRATDEVRDMCRLARNMADVSDENAVNFRVMDTPAQWNSQGIDGIMRFYEMLTPERKAEFCNDWARILDPDYIEEE